MKLKTKKIIYYCIQIYLGIAALSVFFMDEITDNNEEIIAFFIIIGIMYLIKKYFYKKTSVSNDMQNMTKDITQQDESYLYNDRQYEMNESYYTAKPFLTKAEKDFYNKIKELNEAYIIVPQVSLASVVTKGNSKYRNELFKIIDFGIFSKDFDLLLLIELNDKTHEQYYRRDRDLRIKKILNDCNIKIINFYNKYPNEKDYVLQRIKNEINDKITEEETTLKQ